MTEQDKANIVNPLTSAGRIASLASRAFKEENAEVADVFSEIEDQIDQALWCLSNTEPY